MKRVCQICQTRIAAKKRTVCATCRSRQYRRLNPMKAAYIALRDNAKRRNKVFDLTFEEFQKFCIETNYIINKGTQKLSYTIDRIDDTQGYTKDNIQVLTNSDNLKKRHKTLKVKFDYESRTFWAADITPVAIEHEDLPF